MSKKSKKLVVAGKSYSLVTMLTMVAHDLGLPGGKYKVGFLARKVCEKHGWPSGPSRDVILKRAEDLIRSGFTYRRPKKFVPVLVRSESHPDIPKLGAPHPDYKRDDGFYTTDSWRKLRYLALRNCTGCQCCGAKASDGVVLHVDHIQPRYKRPDLSLVLENLQVLCADCNYGKGAWDSTDWRVKMA